MALPKNVSATYQTTLPSNGLKITYREFLVKEQKPLLIAQESGDVEAMARAVRNLIQSCVVAPEIDANSMATFDVEYLFFKLRAKSVGESTDLSIACSECKKENEVRVDVENVDVIRTEGHDTVLRLDDDLGVVMRYPTFDMVNGHEEDIKGVKGTFNTIRNCIESVFKGEEIFPTCDEKPEEVDEFIGSLSAKQVIMIQNFFETMPKIEKKIEFRCTECGHENSMELEGLGDFF